MSDLKPCPFCGGGARLWTPTMRREDGMQPNAKEPACDQCGASMGFFVGTAEAITAWNTRHDAAPELLEAGKLMMVLLAPWEFASPNPPMREAIAAMRAAITKARGLQ